MGPKLSVSVRVGWEIMPAPLAGESGCVTPARGLLLALEIHRDDVGAVFHRLAERVVVFGFLVRREAAVLGLGLELEGEVHGGVDEAGDRREGDDEPRRR